MPSSIPYHKLSSISRHFNYLLYILLLIPPLFLSLSLSYIFSSFFTVPLYFPHLPLFSHLPSFTLFFSLFPWRLSGLTASLLCTMFIWIFKSKEEAVSLPESDINVSVILILLSIMAINFILLKQKIIRTVIHKLQKYIQYKRNLSFWMVSLLAFISSPFITNDGLCLLLVTPVLDGFSFSVGGDNDENDSTDHWIHIIECDRSPFRKWLEYCNINK